MKIHHLTIKEKNYLMKATAEWKFHHFDIHEQNWKKEISSYGRVAGGKVHPCIVFVPSMYFPLNIYSCLVGIVFNLRHPNAMFGIIWGNKWTPFWRHNSIKLQRPTNTLVCIVLPYFSHVQHLVHSTFYIASNLIC